MLGSSNWERPGVPALLPRRGTGPLARDRRATRIVDLVGAAYGVTRAEMLSRRRSLNQVQARQLAMYLVHTLLSRTYQEVGVLFDRDRTTVSHACARIEDQREDKSRFEREVGAIEAAVVREADRAKR